MKIGIIGLGKLGLPVALAIESKGHEVIGYEVNDEIKTNIFKRLIPYHEAGAKELLQTSKIQVAEKLEYLTPCEIIFIAVQTPHEKEYEGVTPLPDTRKDFDYSYLIQACKDVAQLKTDAVIVVISTVLPGTIEREIQPILNVIYNPFFIAMGTTINDFLNPEFVLIGADNVNMRLYNFYKTIHDKKQYWCGIKEAEMIKVSYNTFITTKICIANTIMELCHKVGVSSDVVMEGLFNGTERIISTKYLKGGMGDGGGCHPRDNIALSWLAKEKGLSFDWYENLMKCREEQTKWLADLIVKTWQNYAMPHLYIMGKAFKANTNITTGSPAMLLRQYLSGYKESMITHFEPYEEHEPVNFQRGLYFIATNHDYFAKFVFPKGSVVIDVWRYIPEQEFITLIKIG